MTEEQKMTLFKRAYQNQCAEEWDLANGTIEELRMDQGMSFGFDFVFDLFGLSKEYRRYANHRDSCLPGNKSEEVSNAEV